MRVLLCALYFLTCECVLALPLYRVVGLGDFPGGEDHSQAYALNSASQVAGVGQFTNAVRAFLAGTDANGNVTLSDLGALAGFPTTNANAMNDRGQVVGRSRSTDKARAFLWNPNAPNESSGVMVEIVNLPGERAAGNATGINNLGQVVGYTTPRAFLWTPTVANGTSGNAIDLGALPGDGGSFGLAINDAGQIAGSSLGAAGQRAFLWTPAVPNGNSGAMIDLGFLPGGSALSQATALNGAGEVVGTSATTTGQHAFIWRPNGVGMIDLGDFPGGNDFSYAFGINNARQVVGNGNTADGDHGFLWTEVDGMVDLNSLVDTSGAAWTLRYAQAINAGGQIAGWGEVTHGGIVATHAFRLERVAEVRANQLLLRPEQPNEFRLYFVGRNGSSYQLEAAADLNASWQRLGSAITGTGGIVSITVARNGERSFYRVTAAP